MNTHFVLLDACVAAAHYAPKTTERANLRTRSTTLISGRSEQAEIKLMIPSFCIAEVFAVFEKYRWGRTWNKHVKASRCLTQREFRAAREGFREAIHNGQVILQQELSRYHILSVDLIAPINNAYQIKRPRGGRKKQLRPASTYDMLIVAMAIWLQHQFGSENFTLVTGDDRVRQVVQRAKSVKLGTAMKAHLKEVSDHLGFTYGPHLYPTVVNFTNASRAELKGRFSSWEPDW